MKPEENWEALVNSVGGVGGGAGKNQNGRLYGRDVITSDEGADLI